MPAFLQAFIYSFHDFKLFFLSETCVLEHIEIVIDSMDIFRSQSLTATSYIRQIFNR